MLNVEKHELDGITGFEFVFRMGDNPLSFEDALALMQNSVEFQSLLTNVLHDAPFNGFRWETPALTALSQGQPFRFVLLDAPYLCIAADHFTFARQFDQANANGVCRFENLGHDTLLIVPSPLNPDDNYAHFSAFIHNAPECQIQALWRAVGEAVARRMGSQPLWLNTAGDGVAWLHIRLDSRPKYYKYRPYTTVS